MPDRRLHARPFPRTRAAIAGPWRQLVACAGAATIAVVGGAVTATQTPTLSRNQLLATGSAYVKTYQQQFAFLVADETTVQDAYGVKDSLQVPLGTRTTQGEIFITFLDRHRHWITVRDVAEVDGVRVADRVDLPGLLSNEDANTVARRLFALNARYNIGGVVRNFNDPMLALLPLSDAHRSRFAFDVEKATRQEPGVVLATLSFRERERPTLVRPESGGAAYARGAITIDAATGIVRHTRFTVRYDEIEAELATEFSHDDRMDMWLPSTFSERYRARADGVEDVTTSTSTYSNYRRFQARGRLLDARPQ